MTNYQYVDININFETKDKTLEKYLKAIKNEEIRDKKISIDIPENVKDFYAIIRHQFEIDKRNIKINMSHPTQYMLSVEDTNKMLFDKIVSDPKMQNFFNVIGRYIINDVRHPLGTISTNDTFTNEKTTRDLYVSYTPMPTFFLSKPTRPKSEQNE